MSNKKIAIIGASVGQLPLCIAAKEMGLHTICFAWEQGAICKDFVEKFFPISITEKDAILKICENEKIDGVISNASDLTAETVSFISSKMRTHGIDYVHFLHARDKYLARKITNSIVGLSMIRSQKYEDGISVSFPCIIKPSKGYAKLGVSYVNSQDDFDSAIKYAKERSNDVILIEEYIFGKEISIETLSFEGRHFIIQITDKETSGPPHFVELSHHQPAEVSSIVKNKIISVVPQILSALFIENGAAHIEMKVDDKDNLFLIEVNLRGGGDEISNRLVELSTGYDYVKGMIQIALGDFHAPVIKRQDFSGIYFLCSQRPKRLNAFLDTSRPSWLIDKSFDISNGLNEAVDNYSRNGFLIYKSNNKIILD